MGVGPCLRGESFFGHLNVPHVTFKSVLQIVENASRDRSKTELSIVIFALWKLWGRSGTVSYGLERSGSFVRSRRSFVLSFAGSLLLRSFVCSFVRSFLRSFDRTDERPWGVAVAHPYFL